MSDKIYCSSLKGYNIINVKRNNFIFITSQASHFQLLTHSPSNSHEKHLFGSTYKDIMLVNFQNFDSNILSRN